MTPETGAIPDWARLKRDADLAWIEGNLDLFWAAAAAFTEAGRGAVVVDTTVQTLPGLGHPFAYFLQELIEECGDEDTRRMVDQYDPSQELVLVLLKDQNRTSTYRLSMIPSDHDTVSKETQETPHESAAAPELEVPAIETLMEWEAEGGCEAACPYGCWVEPDGMCPHDNPSWLLKLGFI
jgi:hypothetical protein